MKSLKSLISLVLLLIISTIYAENEFYMGGIVGPGINYFTTSKNYLIVRNPAHASFAWNIFTGVNLTKHWSFELGYLNLGFYENSGDGRSICDTQGNCGYPAVIPLERFHTNLTVVNDINAEFYYTDLVAWILHTTNFNVFLKSGVAYNDVHLKSYVDVFPNISDVGFEIQRTVISKSKNQFSPNFGFGYEYKANKHIFIRSEIDYFYRQNMISKSDGSSQGTLFPIAILFGTRILL